MINFSTQYRIFYFSILASVPVSIYVAATNSIWWLVASFVWMRFMSFIFVHIGLHRYFAHNSFVTGPKRHSLLALGSILTGNGSPVTWSTHHLHHHRYSDTQGDLHSPVHGWTHTALLWPIREEKYFGENKQISISPKRLVKDPLLMWIHQNYFRVWIVMIAVMTAISWEFALFGLLAPAGWSVLHGNIISNLISHWRIAGSYRNFETADNSYNNKWVQLLQFGEGLHNNHHNDMRNYNQAVNPGEHDPAAWVIDRFFKIHYDKNNLQSRRTF